MSAKLSVEKKKVVCRISDIRSILWAIVSGAVFCFEHDERDTLMRYRSALFSPAELNCEMTSICQLSRRTMLMYVDICWICVESWEDDWRPSEVMPSHEINIHNRINQRKLDRGLTLCSHWCWPPEYWMFRSLALTYLSSFHAQQEFMSETLSRCFLRHKHQLDDAFMCIYTMLKYNFINYEYRTQSQWFNSRIL